MLAGGLVGGLLVGFVGLLVSCWWVLVVCWWIGWKAGELANGLLLGFDALLASWLVGRWWAVPKGRTSLCT